MFISTGTSALIGGLFVGVDTNTFAVYGLLITFLSGVIKQFVDSWKEQKQREQDRADAIQRHQWDREDRMLVAQKVEATAQLTAQTSALISDKLDRGKELISQAIDKADTAYKEANGYNNKLTELRVENALNTPSPAQVAAVMAQAQMAAGPAPTPAIPQQATVHISQDDLPLRVTLEDEKVEK